MRVNRSALIGAAVGALLLGGATPVSSASVAPPARPETAALAGVWEAVQVNRQPLPMTDAVVGNDGLTHTVRLHSMVIRLNANGRFQAALRYRRAILARAQRIDGQPLLNDTWVGTYTQTGTSLRFVPERKGNQRVQPFSGDLRGRRITVAFDYENVTRKHYVLDLDRNENVH